MRRGSFRPHASLWPLLCCWIFSAKRSPARKNREEGAIVRPALVAPSRLSIPDHPRAGACMAAAPTSDRGRRLGPALGRRAGFAPRRAAGRDPSRLSRDQGESSRGHARTPSGRGTPDAPPTLQETSLHGGPDLPGLWGREMVRSGPTHGRELCDGQPHASQHSTED